MPWNGVVPGCCLDAFKCFVVTFSLVLRLCMRGPNIHIRNVMCNNQDIRRPHLYYPIVSSLVKDA